MIIKSKILDGTYDILRVINEIGYDGTKIT